MEIDLTKHKKSGGVGAPKAVGIKFDNKGDYKDAYAAFLKIRNTGVNMTSLISDMVIQVAKGIK